MDPITIGIICWISSAVAISIGSSQDTNDKNQKAPPKIVKTQPKQLCSMVIQGQANQALSMN